MRTNIRKALCVAATIITITSGVSAASCTNLTKFLSKGSENSEVLSLQQFLADGGYLLVKPNGYFGENTKKAVILFQKSQKIAGVGTVGPYTRSKIKEISCTVSSSQNGSTVTNNVVATDKEKTTVATNTTQVAVPAQVIVPAQVMSVVTPPVVAPTIYVKTYLATNVTSESATLKGSGGIDGEKHWFEWGNTMEMKSATPQSSSTINYSYVLTGLAPNTSYFFRAVTSVASSSDRRAETAYGEMRYFTTPLKAATEAAKVSPTVTITSTGVAVNASGSAKVTWTSANANTCTFTQGESGGSWTNQSALTGEYITLPMTSSAVFGISCKDIGGYTVTGSVTVPKIVN
jgi:peptidoglycan hydrolase-like protein with peptidoglycan-binding domain